jgi:hypothetical protein
MSIKALGSETTFVETSHPTSNDIATSYRAAYSRGSVVISNVGYPGYVRLPAAVSALAMKWQNGGQIDDESNIGWFTVYDSSGVAFFRAIGSGGGYNFLLQYWNGTTWITSGAAGVLANTNAEVVLMLTPGTSGSYEIFIAGVLNASGSINVSSTDIKHIKIQQGDDDSPIYYSEFILADQATSLIASAVETEAPTADGTDTDGTGTYANVDEALIDTADVIELAASADRHSFTSPARTGTMNRVLGVSVSMRMRCDVTGPNQAKFYLKIGGTRYYGSTFTLTTGSLPYSYVWETNPSTGVQWTVSDANSSGLEWGVEVV